MLLKLTELYALTKILPGLTTAKQDELILSLLETEFNNRLLNISIDLILKREELELVSWAVLGIERLYLINESGDKDRATQAFDQLILLFYTAPVERLVRPIVEGTSILGTFLKLLNNSLKESLISSRPPKCYEALLTLLGMYIKKCSAHLNIEDSEAQAQFKEIERSLIMIQSLTDKSHPLFNEKRKLKQVFLKCIEKTALVASFETDVVSPFSVARVDPSRAIDQANVHSGGFALG